MPDIQPTLAASVGQTSAGRHRSASWPFCTRPGAIGLKLAEALAQGHTAPLMCQLSSEGTRVVLGGGGREELGRGLRDRRLMLISEDRRPIPESGQPSCIAICTERETAMWQHPDQV